jgi:hypothetical protein
MWVLILEVIAAFFIFAFIVWWTMFAGRKSELSEPEQNQTIAKQDDHADRPKAP